MSLESYWKDEQHSSKKFPLVCVLLVLVESVLIVTSQSEMGVQLCRELVTVHFCIRQTIR